MLERNSWNRYASHATVDGVRSLDLVAGHTENEQHSIEEGMRQSSVHDLPQRRLGVARPAKAHGVEHVDSVGTDTDGDGLVTLHPDPIVGRSQHHGLRGA